MAHFKHMDTEAKYSLKRFHTLKAANYSLDTSAPSVGPNTELFSNFLIFSIRQCCISYTVFAYHARHPLPIPPCLVTARI